MSESVDKMICWRVEGKFYFLLLLENFLHHVTHSFGVFITLCNFVIIEFSFSSFQYFVLSNYKLTINPFMAGEPCSSPRSFQLSFITFSSVYIVGKQWLWKMNDDCRLSCRSMMIKDTSQWLIVVVWWRDFNSCCMSAIFMSFAFLVVTVTNMDDGFGWCIIHSNRLWSDIISLTVRSWKTCSWSQVTTTPKTWPERRVADDTFWVKCKDSNNERGFFDSPSDGLSKWKFRSPTGTSSPAESRRLSYERIKLIHKHVGE